MPRSSKITDKQKLMEECKKIKIPEPGELVKTSNALCYLCKYNAILSGTYVICDYFLITHNIRGCKCGECNKFEMLTRKKKPKIPAEWY
jgi:hypothetical protein